MDIELMDKGQLRDYALEQFKVKVDMRKDVEKIREEVKGMTTKTEAVKDKPKARKPKFLKNEATGFWWPWTQLLADRGDLVPCDEDGNVSE